MQTVKLESLVNEANKHLSERSGFDQQRADLLAHFVRPGKRVVEWGCGSGDILARLAPAHAVGLDQDEVQVQAVRHRYGSTIEAIHQDVLDLSPTLEIEPFDYILMDLLVGHLGDVQCALELALQWAHPRTRLVLTSKNVLYGPVNRAMKVGKSPRPINWLSRADLKNLLELSGWELVLCRCEQLFPFRLPLIAGLLNRWIVRLPVFYHLGTTILMMARPLRLGCARQPTTCSVIVPARNESGHIRSALERIPQLGTDTEVIFVEGNSQDDTWDVIQSECQRYQGPLRLKYLKQPGIGKWDAVRAGFAEASGEVLVIQDADLTAPPEDLPKFFRAITEGYAEFGNGSRLVYPMEQQAMRFLNLLGNKGFALTLSWVLGQSVKDSLCGTKMLLREDYDELIPLVHERLGDFDPFGDFNLLFGAAMMGLRIRDIPVRYRERIYGETNISRFRHGFILLKMTGLALRRIHFFPY